MQPLEHIAPGGEHEDVTGDAGQKAGGYLSIALAVAQRHLDARLHHAADSAGSPAAGAAELGAGELDEARRRWSVMLDKTRGAGADSQQALDAWMASLPHREQHGDARIANSRAEDRLRVLHPDALTRYDALRRGLNPVEAMRQVAPLIDASRDGLDTARDTAQEFLRRRGGTMADTDAVRAAWEATAGFPDRDDTIAVAHAQAEQRLRTLHPDAMARYDALRRGLIDPDAMRTATDELPAAQRLTINEMTAGSRADGQRPAGDSLLAKDTTDSDTVMWGDTDTTRSADTSASSSSTTAATPAATRTVVVRDYSDLVSGVLGAELAAAVIADAHWADLQDRLDRIAQLGDDPAAVLRTAAQQRELDTAKSPAQVLNHRLDTGPAAAVATTAKPVSSNATRTTAQHSETAQDSAGLAPAGSTLANSTLADSTPASDRAAVGESRLPATPLGAVAASYPDHLSQVPAPTYTGVDAGAVNATAVQIERGEQALTVMRDLAATPDDPATPRVDEHHDALATAGVRTPPALADVDHGTANLTTATATATATAAARPLPQARVAGPPGAASFPQSLAGVDLAAASAAAAAAAGGQQHTSTQSATRPPSPAAHR